ncbi:hypothetical protein ONS95_014241 [Cadophora gregata]|uniref:uncharacterized protein n=1 Tax=Cadophora gregata TaxID=51156 RepID=UPI0026DD77AA|nr:uncharacterized protein ONS95_014241 [Cadophora gregata]KAK0114757.1 hypothetical protein ONS95_014241 [Cadophora gregata]
MAEYTVGQVAGAINIGLLFLQVTLPLLHVLVLVGTLRNKSTAISWSVISRFIQSTVWPSILSCDTAAGRREGVMTRVVFMSWLALISTLLLAVAGILTPIGLGEAIFLSGKTEATFLYAKDRSAFGGAAGSREQYSNSRTCNFGKSPCPGVRENDTVTVLAEMTDHGKMPVTFYQNYISENITECFSSGSRGSLISSPFEIQFRQFDASSNEHNLTAKKNTTGTFYWTEHTLLLDSIVCREGLIIDAINGGVGFRNHTVPELPQTVHGAAWTEDILWLEPDTVCVNTNWSISTEFQLAPFSVGGLFVGTNTWLLREGDGVDPKLDIEFPTFGNTISSPDLLGRANTAAAIFDYHLSWLLNLDQSNFSTGAYNITSDSDLVRSFLSSGYDRCSLVFGSLTEPTYAVMWNSVINTDNGTVLNGTSLGINSPWASNGNTSDLTWSFGLESCKSLNGTELFRPGLVNVDCTYLITPPRAKRYDSQGSPEEWTSSINVCASSPRAIIKTVHFQYNETSDIPALDGLKVIKAEPKVYASNEDLPLWGIENPGLNLSIHQMQVLWGLVDKDYSDSQALWTHQSETFYIPATYEDGIELYFGDSMAATRLPGIVNSFT